ncbi:MAG: serine/threonine-protein kinase [Myxococcota bacterium]
MIMHIDSRYQIIEKAGSGGMATVYRARDTVLNRDVAIKLLHPHLIEKDEVKKRFLREAQAIARLRHRNIIEIFDYKSDENDCYIISEFVKGKSLASFLSEYDISSPFIAAMMVSILSDAIGHAHRNGIVHRDIKPENILISENFILKITDFGIAHIADAESLTITGSISGSPAHMSPEQIDGKDVDFRTDIFSLGTLLYLIACGELPFKGNSPASIFKSILLGEYREPKELNPLIDNKFSNIIHTSLKKNIDERYKDAEELKKELLEYLHLYGITDVEGELSSFFKRPLEYLEELQKRIIGHLKDYLYKNIKNKESRIQIQDSLNILLYLAPEDIDARALFERFSSLEIRDRRRNSIKRGLLFIPFIVFIFFIIFQLFFTHQRGNISIMAQDDINGMSFVQDVYSDYIQIAEDVKPSKEANNNSSEQQWEINQEIKRHKKKLLSFKKDEKGVKAEEFPSSEVPKFGQINLFIKPYGDIYIDNNLYAKEKAAVSLRLRAGRHNLKIKNPFYFDIEKEINVDENKKTDIRLIFDRIKPAKIFINTNTECDIYIDGNLLGRSDMYIKNGITIPITSSDGRREIILKATKSGYKDFITKIELRAGESNTIKINMIKER